MSSGLLNVVMALFYPSGVGIINSARLFGLPSALAMGCFTEGVVDVTIETGGVDA